MKQKKYKVFVALRADGVWVTVDAYNKAEAQFLALDEATRHICEGEAYPYWEVVPSMTRVVKDGENGN